MGKPNNIIDFEKARTLRQADPKATSKAMKKALDRINKRADKVPQKNSMPFSKDYRLVKKVLKCRTVCSLFSRLDYRFNIMPDGFYKFMAPCKNKYYRKGDSISEEMELHRDTVWRAAKKIVTAYKSKALYENAKASLGGIGVFQGKPYLSYLDKNTHQTFYLRNRAVADLILEGKNPFKRKMFNRIKFNPYHAVFRLLKVKNPTHHKSENPTHVSRKIRHIDAPEPAVYKASQPLQRIHTKNTSLSISLSGEKPPSEEKLQTEFREREIKKVVLEEQPLVETDNASEMVKVWTETTNREKEKFQTRETMVNLDKVLEARFNSSLQEWEKFCRLITSSKWLMGDIVSQKTGKGFNINLAWASKEENIDKIMGGEYTMGDRSNAVKIPLREPRHQDPYVLSFMRKALETMGEPMYVSYMQTAQIDKTPRGEITIRFPYAYTAQYVAHNDLLRLGSFMGSVGVPAALICKPDGGVVKRIEARNGSIMNLR